MKIKHESLIEHVFDNDAIIVPMGINNSFSSGFLKEVSVNFPETVNADAKTPYGDKRKFGTVIECEDNGILFYLSYFSKGGYQKHKPNTCIIDLNALSLCLKKISQRCGDKKVAFPLIYDEENNNVLDVVKRELGQCIVYQYQQRNFSLEIFKEIAKVRKMAIDKEITKEEYSKKRSEIEWRRKNGIYTPMPEDYTYVPKMQYREEILKIN